jgi:methanogenic corrinoid protein MtbC1
VTTPTDGNSPAGSEPVDLDTLVAELTDRSAAADRYGAAARVRQLLAGGVRDVTIREAVGLAQREVGRRWQAGLWTITQEHAATAVAETVLAVLEHESTPATRQRDEVGRVALVAAEGEWHALPLRLVGQAFAQEGLDTVYLGTGVPATDVARTLPALDVDALAVSVTVPANLFGAARTIAAGQAASLPVLLGGAASTPERAAALGADAYGTTAAEGARTARSWATDGPPTSFARLELDLAAGAALHGARAQVVAAAHEHVEDGWSELGGVSDDPTDHVDHILEDLQQLIDHLATAVLLGDREIVDAEVRWLAEVHAGRRLPAALLSLELDALSVALDGHDAARELARTAPRG